MFRQIIWTVRGINSPLTASALGSNRGLPNNLRFRCEIPRAAREGLSLSACFSLTCEFILPSRCLPSCKLRTPWLVPLPVCLPRRDAHHHLSKIHASPLPACHSRCFASWLNLFFHIKFNFVLTFKDHNNLDYLW